MGGTDDRRPELERLLDMAVPDGTPFDVVVVHSFSLWVAKYKSGGDRSLHHAWRPHRRGRFQTAPRRRFINLPIRRPHGYIFFRSSKIADDRKCNRIIHPSRVDFPS